MRAAVEGDRADRRAGVDSEQRGLAIDFGANEQMILRRADERKGDVLQAARLQRGRSRARDRGQAKNRGKQES